jgi:hypothetical protein
MKPQDPPTAPTPGPEFAPSVDAAAVGLHVYKQTAHHALALGVRAADLVRYVSGDVTRDERKALQELLARSDWAMSRVVALTKARRNPNSLAARLLEGEFNPYAWGVMRTEDPEMDAATLLERI